MSGELILDFPAQRKPLVHVRSTLLVASMNSLRDVQRFDDWAKAIDAKTRDALLSAPAGVWVPLETAMAHYRAVDALSMTAEEMSALGQTVFKRISGTILGTMVDLARDAGVTPWTLYKQFQRFWSRAFDGGSIRVTQLAPKDAKLELVDCPLLDIRYFRASFQGHVTGMTQLFCRKAYLREDPNAPRTSSVTYRAQWV